MRRTVFDRQTQMLTAYLDGRLDGEPCPIAAIGRSTTTSPLTLGAFGGGFPFDGVLDEDFDPPRRVEARRVLIRRRQYRRAA